MKRSRSLKKASSFKKTRKASPSNSLINLLHSLLFSNKKRRPSSSLIKFFRWSCSLLVVALFLLWSGLQSLPPPIPSGDQLPLLYSNQCNDNLRSLHLEAISSAQRSILLYMYSLSDGRIIRALNEKADAGIRVTVIHDPSTPQFGYQKLKENIHRIPKISKGLMHQKILVIDEEKILLGSANFTTESLRMHDNLVIGIHSPILAKVLVEHAAKYPHDFLIGGQHVEYWSLPEDKSDGFQRLLSLIDSAQKTLRVAMFTLTHPELTNALIRAHERHVDVEVVVDAQQAQGASLKRVEELTAHHIPVKVNRGTELFHHKFAYIDGKILINGSANWTKAAFSKNNDCFLILHDLQEQQVIKMDKLWHAIRAISRPASEDKLTNLPQAA